MTKSSRNFLLVIVFLLAIAAIWLFAHGHAHFDWANLKIQLHAINWIFIALACAVIYTSNLLRAFRWKLLLGNATAIRAWRLIPAQYIGFTVVALLGRVADLTRPYLVARRTRTPVATQLAVYSIERAFDLAAAAILFSFTLVLAPKNMPHHEQIVLAGRGAVVLILLISIFALAVRFTGSALAAIAKRVGGIVSPSFGETASTKILELGAGMRTLATFTQFAGTLAWSIVIWTLIAATYLFTMRAFTGTPSLAFVPVSGMMLILASSMAGSLVQLPVIGWFSQIAVLAGAISGGLGVPLEVASACGTVLLVVTTLSIVPAGLICAKVEGVGLRAAAAAGEAVADETHSTD